MSWTETDLIVRGLFCSLHELRFAVDASRKSTDSALALLLVAWGNKLFTSLTVVSTDDANLARRLSESISLVCRHEHHRAAIADCVDDHQLVSRLTKGFQRVPLTRFPHVLAELLNSDAPATDIYAANITCSEPLQLTGPTMGQQVGANALFLLFDAKRPAHMADLDDLGIMINATPPVLTERTQRTVRALERDVYSTFAQIEANAISEAHYQALHHGDSQFPGSLKPLCDAICANFKATLCALYFVAPNDRSRFNLAGASMGHLFVDHFIYSGRAPRPVMHDALTKEKIILGRLHDITDLGCLNGERVAPDAPIDAMAVPVLEQVIGTTRFSRIGALIILRGLSLPVSKALSYHDYLAARELSWRLSVLYRRLQVAESHARFDTLARQVAAAPTERLTLNSHEIAAALATFSGDSNAATAPSPQLGHSVTIAPRPEIPVELLPCQHLADSVARSAAKMTNAIFSTVRLLSPDNRFLVRFCSSPPIPADDPYRLLRLDHHNVITAQAAKAGEVRFAARTEVGRWVNEAAHAVEYIDPPLDREANAVLCVPLYCRLRLCGTLTLESNQGAAFRAHLPMARQYANLLSQLFATTANAWASPILSLSTDLILKLHDVKQVSDWIREAMSVLGELSDEERSRLRRLLTLLGESNALLTRIIPPTVVRDRFPPLHYAGEASVIQLVEQFVVSLLAERRVGAKATIDIRVVKKKDADRILQSEHVRPLSIALQEVLTNACKSVQSQLEPSVTISFTVGFLFSQRFVNVHVRCNRARSVSTDISNVLYRLPFISDPERPPHLGGFIAGSTMRAIGGDVYLACNDTSCFETIIQVPVS